MGALIDILASMFVAGILVLTTMIAMENSVQNFVGHNADAIVQNELATMTEIIQSDLRKMGYEIPEWNQSNIIQHADSMRVKFLTDLNVDGTADTMQYQIVQFDSVQFADTSIVLFAVNRTVRMAGQAPSTRQIGTISNRRVFRYLDQAGREVDYVPATKMVEVTLIALNPQVYLDDDYLAAVTPAERSEALRDMFKLSFWRQTRVISKNLRR